MRVLQIYPQYKINNSPMNARTHKKCDSLSFKSWMRERYLKTGFNRNNTSFFRDGDFIKNLTDMLSEKFKDIPKVNVYCFGCSDGSEALSFIMNMLANTKEINPQKFFPIIARDIDPFAIDKAMKQVHHMTKDEKDRVNYYTNGQYDRFVEQPYGEPREPIDKNDCGTRILIKKDLFDNVDFAVGDIFENYKEIEPENSVVMARNFWPYVKGSEKRKQFFKDLYQHLDFGSYFVIGNFDQKGLIYNLQGDLRADLEHRIGFKPTSIENVFVK